MLRFGGQWACSPTDDKNGSVSEIPQEKEPKSEEENGSTVRIEDVLGNTKCGGERGSEATSERTGNAKEPKISDSRGCVRSENGNGKQSPENMWVSWRVAAFISRWNGNPVADKNEGNRQTPEATIREEGGIATGWVSGLMGARVRCHRSSEQRGGWGMLKGGGDRVGRHLSRANQRLGRFCQ